MFARSPEERAQYQARLKAERDYRWRISIADRAGYERGLQEGREEGRKEGRKEGLAIGEAKGRKLALAELVQILQELLRQPVTPTDELTALEIEQLRQRCESLTKQVNERSP